MAPDLIGPRRLNLGAGWERLPGYLSVDIQPFHEPDLVGDVRELGMLPSGSYEEVLARDVLEHLGRRDAPSALREWHRLLEAGGRLRLRVPDLPSLLRMLGDSDDPEDHRRIMQLLLGTQAYDGDYHHAGFTDVLLSDELLSAGFGRIELELRDGWLWEGRAVKLGEEGEGHDLDRLALCWGPGFYQQEHDGNGSWRWADAEGELLVMNGALGAADLTLTLTVSGAGPGERSLTLTGPSVQERFGLGPALVTAALPLTLPPGASRFRLAADGEPLDAPGDRRRLFYRVHALGWG